MNPITAPEYVNPQSTGVQHNAHHWLRFTLVPLLILITILSLSVLAMTVSTTADVWAQEGGTIPGGTIPDGTIPGGTLPQPAVIYLGFKHSDEIEFPDDAQPDFVYKNEDIVAFDPATRQFSIFFDGSACGLADANLDDFDILPNGNLIFTLRSSFTLPGLGEVDDSDIIEYTPNAAGCGAFAMRVKGADVGLTKGSEDIDGLGIAADGGLLVSTIGTAVVPSANGGELKVRDQSLIKLDEATKTWSLYFDGEDVGLVGSSEDIRSVWQPSVLDTQGFATVFLTLSGDFAISSDNSDQGDKNDVEGCTLFQSGENTECFFYKLLNGDKVGAENQLDGLAIVLGPAIAPITALKGLDGANSAEAAAESASDAADYAEALAEGDSGVSMNDFLDIATELYLPYIQQ
ncbi:MAG: hypothetical protein R3C14_00350 [Caldilineaceae bacterium]